MNEKYIFKIYISDGYSFRNTIGIARNEVDNTTMVLTSENVIISFLNRNKYCLHKIIFKTVDFSEYYYDFDNEKSYVVSFETESIFNTTKGLGKKDGVIISLLKNENRINIELIKNSVKSNTNSGCLYVKILNLEYINYKIQNNYEDIPNLRIHIKDFADLCTQINTLRCKHLDFFGLKNKLLLKGVSHSETELYANEFNLKKPIEKNDSNGETDSCNDNPIEHFRIPISTIKALSKIHNISHQGSQMSFFFTKNNYDPIKLSFPIGSYGEYQIYLRDNES